MKKAVKWIIAGGIAVAGIFTARKVAAGNRSIEVTPVYMLNMGSWGDQDSYSGYVSSANMQSVKPDDTQVVKEIYVHAGDTVKTGDPLLAYDITSNQLALDKKALAVEQAGQQLAQAKQKLSVLNNTTPIGEVNTDPYYDVPTGQDTDGNWLLLDENSTPAEPEKKEEPENPEDPQNPGGPADPGVPKEEPKQGTREKPYVFYLSKDGVIKGSFFAQWADHYVTIITRTGTDEISSWTVMGSAMTDFDSETYYHALTLREVEPVYPPIPQGYTAAELQEMIKSTSREIKDLDLAYRRVQQEYKEMQDTSSDGIVRAKQDGIVKKACTVDSIPTDGSALIEVSQDAGTMISASVSELALDKVQPGTELNVTDYMNGMTYTAVVKSVDTYPQSGMNNYYGGNPNVSYYTFKAEVDGDNSLTEGNYVDLAPLDVTYDTISLQMAYIRNDGNGYYVMKDQDGVLVRQNIQIGKTYYGHVAVILDGITTDDSIAFPYDKNAVEGAKTKATDMDYYGG